MQYKIPVQIENEDTIIFNLSIKQLFVIMAGMWIWYMFFSWLSPILTPEIAFIPAFLIFWLGVFIAVFKYSEMNFITFLLAFIRYTVNISVRKWIKWVDSFSVLDTWYITQNQKVDKKVDFWDKLDKIKEIDKKLDKI